jgi:hypothetical protein
MIDAIESKKCNANAHGTALPGDMRTSVANDYIFEEIVIRHIEVLPLPSVYTLGAQPHTPVTHPQYFGCNL